MGVKCLCMLRTVFAATVSRTDRPINLYFPALIVTYFLTLTDERLLVRNENKLMTAVKSVKLTLIITYLRNCIYVSVTLREAFKRSGVLINIALNHIASLNQLQSSYQS